MKYCSFLFFIALCLAAKAQTAAFKHLTTAGTPRSITTNRSRIDNPATDNRPNALLFVTLDGGGSTESYYLNPHNKATGVWYDAVANRWLIMTPVGTAMTPDTKFNVLVVEPGTRAFIHTAAPGNMNMGRADETVLNRDLLNGKPGARIMVTPHASIHAPGALGFNSNPFGVRFVNSGSGGHWIIFNQNGAPILVGSKFNILVDDDSHPKMFVVEEWLSRDRNLLTFPFSNRATDNMPDALVFATQFRDNARETDDGYIGVMWGVVPEGENKWSILSQRGEGAFHHHVPPHSPETLLHAKFFVMAVTPDIFDYSWWRTAAIIMGIILLVPIGYFVYRRSKPASNKPDPRPSG